MTIAEELAEQRRRRRLAGDPRVTPEGRELMLRLVAGDLIDTFQAGLDEIAAADPTLAGHPDDDSAA